jgi:hypothetical protein
LANPGQGMTARGRFVVTMGFFVSTSGFSYPLWNFIVFSVFLWQPLYVTSHNIYYVNFGCCKKADNEGIPEKEAISMDLSAKNPHLGHLQRKKTSYRANMGAHQS